MAGRPKATRSFRAKHSALYASERDCARYDALCSRQDHAGNTLAELLSVVAGDNMASLHVVDVGTGTGKLARLLAPHVQSVSAFDRSDDMITAARAATALQWRMCAACLCRTAVPGLWSPAGPSRT